MSSYYTDADLVRHDYLIHGLALFVTPTSVCTDGAISDHSPLQLLCYLNMEAISKPSVWYFSEFLNITQIKSV